jgi:hypothetical protein
MINVQGVRGPLHMQLLTREYIAGQFYNMGRGKYTRNAEKKEIHPCKGNQQCGFR